MKHRPAGLLPAVGLAARDDAGRLLLVRRRDDDAWSLPGGHLEVGESWQAGAERECREETGWEVAVSGLLGVYSDPATQLHTFPDGRRRHLVGVVFEGTVVRLVGEPDDECSEVRFFAPSELPPVLFAPDRPLIEDALSGAPRPFVR